MTTETEPTNGRAGRAKPKAKPKGKPKPKPKPKPKAMTEAVARKAAQKWAALINSTVSALLESAYATQEECARHPALGDVLPEYGLKELIHALQDIENQSLVLAPSNPLSLSIPSAAEMVE